LWSALGIATYTYCGNGLRQTKSVTQNGVTTNTRHLWDGAFVVGDIISTPNDPTNPQTNFTATFNRGLGGELISTTQRGQTFTYLHDGMRNVVSLLDSNGNSVDNFVLDAFGNLQNEPNNAIHNPFTFRGGDYYFDQHTGFYYLRFRFLDPNLGRFLNEDPIRWGHNWFIYADNNPIRFMDFWGLAPGDLFRTINEAAIDFGFYYNARSIEYNLEFGSTIYRVYVDGEPFYTYTVANIGTHYSVDISFPACGIINVVAAIHTHGAYMEGYYKDFFSGLPIIDMEHLLATGEIVFRFPDYGDIAMAERTGWPEFIVTPSGTLLRYDPTGDPSLEVSAAVISTIMPADSNHPRVRGVYVASGRGVHFRNLSLGFSVMTGDGLRFGALD